MPVTFATRTGGAHDTAPATSRGIPRPSRIVHDYTHDNPLPSTGTSYHGAGAETWRLGWRHMLRKRVWCVVRARRGAGVRPKDGLRGELREVQCVVLQGVRERRWSSSPSPPSLRHKPSHQYTQGYIHRPWGFALPPAIPPFQGQAENAAGVMQVEVRKAVASTSAGTSPSSDMRRVGSGHRRPRVVGHTTVFAPPLVRSSHAASLLLHFTYILLFSLARPTFPSSHHSVLTLRPSSLHCVVATPATEAMRCLCSLCLHPFAPLLPFTPPAPFLSLIPSLPQSSLDSPYLSPPFVAFVLAYAAFPSVLFSCLPVPFPRPSRFFLLPFPRSPHNLPSLYLSTTPVVFVIAYMLRLPPFSSPVCLSLSFLSSSLPRALLPPSLPSLPAYPSRLSLPSLICLLPTPPTPSTSRPAHAHPKLAPCPEEEAVLGFAEERRLPGVAEKHAAGISAPGQRVPVLMGVLAPDVVDALETPQCPG
ncbi:hypothetical protein B0H12DRAFT_1241694 [Mycena haematopus]|nr:hypothetical protein B0H12DRAFT_1241694 [Mycena haematopus]